MNHNIARWLYDGAIALCNGRREEARSLLMRVLEHDESNELAWLWLSGAVDDPADQQIALENVLAINPHNQAARQGLEWLQTSTAAAPTSTAAAAPTAGAWTPPPPFDQEEPVELTCWSCGASLYSVAKFCWQCHSPVHSCNNCTFRLETRCKELQGLTSTITQSAINECPWWRPAGH